MTKQQISGSSFIRTQYHWLGKDQFCSGAAFVPRVGGSHEDDGWIISFIHNEKNNTSQASFYCIYTHQPSRHKSDAGNQHWNLYVFTLQVHIIDAQRFEDAPVAKITMPRRVPYGFHGNFISR